MSVFVDTSAFIALVHTNDVNHALAKQIWDRLVSERPVLITTNYVFVETTSLVQSRYGMNVVRAFRDLVVSLVQVYWVDHELHRTALEQFFRVGRRDLSLVDCTSFEVILHLQLQHVFTFDRHFFEQGFHCLTS
jgi:predicted nucleic acid-binding protein